MRADLPSGQALGAQRDHHLIDAVQAPLALADRLRVERAVTITRHVKLHRADLGQHRLRAGAIARVAAVAALARVLVIAQMLAHLDLKPGLQHPLGEPGQQPVGADQVDPLAASLLHQLRHELLIGAWRVRRRRRAGIVHRRLGHIGPSWPSLPAQPVRPT